MKKLWPWFIGIGVFIILITVLLVGLGFLRYSHTPVTMMGDRIRAFGDYDRYWAYRDNVDRTSWTFPVLNLVGILLMVAVPFGILALIVLGVIMLVRSSKKVDEPPMQQEALVCPACGKAVQREWKVCPYCGERLEP